MMEEERGRKSIWSSTPVLVTLAVIGVLLTPVIILSYSYVMHNFFTPKFQNVDRKIFENTKSYVQGAQSDLGNYYKEYQEATSLKDKEVIREVIRARFPELDPEHIQSPALRKFLVNARGY